jgi:hypothetical protein
MTCNVIGWACWRVQEEQQSAEARVEAVHAQLERAAAARLEARCRQQVLHKRSSDASGQLLAVRVRASSDVNLGLASPAAKASKTSPPRPPQAQRQQVTAQCAAYGLSVFSRTTRTELPNSSKLTRHVPLRIADIAAHAEHSSRTVATSGASVAAASDPDQHCFFFDMEEHVCAYQHAVAHRLACCVDQVGWWLQLHVDVAPGMPLSMGTVCASAACAASMCLMYNLSTAESLALMASERCLTEACNADGAPC